jgi:tRNA(adenine34) deaminase
MTDPVRGGAVSRFQILNTADLNHAVEVETGLMEPDCTAVMQEFFKTLRKSSKQRKQQEHIQHPEKD